MSFGDTWARAGDEKIEPPKGTYNIEIIDGSAFESKDGREFAKVVLKITAGELEGSVFEHFMNFQPDGIAQMNREALLAYGLEDAEGVRSITDLDDRIARLKGRTAEVGVSYKDNYMNVRVNGSRAPAGEERSDIPTDTPPANGGQGSFAAAAGQKADDSDSIPFAPSVI